MKPVEEMSLDELKAEVKRLRLRAGAVERLCELAENYNRDYMALLISFNRARFNRDENQAAELDKRIHELNAKLKAAIDAARKEVGRD